MPKQVLVKMLKECKSYMKAYYKKSEHLCKSFYRIVFLDMCKSFQLMQTGLEAKKKYCVGGVSKDFEKKWDRNLRDMESKRRDLLLEEYCKKLFDGLFLGNSC